MRFAVNAQKSAQSVESSHQLATEHCRVLVVKKRLPLLVKMKDSFFSRGATDLSLLAHFSD